MFELFAPLSCCCTYSCCCFTMSNAEEVRADDGDTEERKHFVTVHVPKPVLLAKDRAKIKEDSGGQVGARVREHNGVRKLLLKSPLTCE